MPNTTGNSLETATVLTLTPNIQSFTDRVTPAASDYYRFTLASRSSLELSLSHLSADANVSLLDSTGAQLNLNGVPQRSANLGTAPEFINTILEAGTYYIQVTAESLVATADYNLNLASTSLLGEIRGTVWNDLDGDGVREGNEPGLANWTVYLDQNQNGQLDAGEQSTTSDVNGGYRFANLVAGSYTIAQVLQSGWQQTVPVSSSPTLGRYTIDLAPGEIELGLNWGDRAILSTVSLTQRVTGLSNPVFVTHAGDSSDRLFVVEQSGRIRIVQNGTLVSTPFLNISNRLRSGGEEGLLSVAFSPNYATNGRFYVFYTNQVGNLVIARYQVSSNANIADPNSEQIILTINHPTYSNHNGGQLAFGPDGYLYIGTGDGGSGGDPANNAQNPNSLLGKILRIDVESPGVTTYAIPSTNPFGVDKDPNNLVRDEIWAWGLRNPWRFSFDRQSGDLFIADVGQGSYEEINYQPASSTGGENYGWRIMEGSQPFLSNGNDTAGLILPVAEYDHSQGISVTGGYVYRGTADPRLQGIYFYGDFGSGRIWGLRRNTTGWETQMLLDSPYAVSTFGEDQQGNLYLADYFGGTIYQVTT
jgi:glucose/arabinose dehydrogenase